MKRAHYFLTTTVRCLSSSWRNTLQAVRLPPETLVYLSSTRTGQEWGFDRSRATIWVESASQPWRNEQWFFPVGTRDRRELRLSSWMVAEEVPADELALRQLAEVE